MARLCHDLGHCPSSFEQARYPFVPRIVETEMGEVRLLARIVERLAHGIRGHGKHAAHRYAG